jgi:hypothetical protein
VSDDLPAPAKYLLGPQRIALLRAFAGEHGRAFTEARLAEVRALLDAAPTLPRDQGIGA